jgi:hypothetical protein
MTISWGCQTRSESQPASYCPEPAASKKTNKNNEIRHHHRVARDPVRETILVELDAGDGQTLHLAA